VPPVTPTELIVLALLAAALLLVPSALAFALFSLSRTDEPELAPPAPAPARRRSPRRVASGFDRAGRRPPHRPGPPGRRRFDAR
jgi:hypothetical protein